MSDSGTPEQEKPDFSRLEELQREKEEVDRKIEELERELEREKEELERENIELRRNWKCEDCVREIQEYVDQGKLPQSALADVQRLVDEVLQSSATPPQSSTKKSKRPRCSHLGCKAAPFIGADCDYCQNRFCSRHRLPESHSCSNLQTVREIEKARNEAKVRGEATKQTKI